MALPTTMLVLPVLLLIAFSGLLPRWLAPPPTFTERLDVSQQHLTGPTYLSFMTLLDSAVKLTADEWIRLHPVLREQRLKTTPACWVNVELMDGDGQRLLTLALRSDNLYVSGYANRHGEWFAFAGQQATLPGSTALSYTGNYDDIFGPRGYRGLGTVQVNRAEALTNALLLADYRSGGPSPDSDTTLKPALGFFLLTIAEAERFPRLRAVLADAMDAPTPQTMSQRLVRRAVNWKRLSCALRAWDRYGQTMAVWNANTEAHDLEGEIAVYTPEAALAEIQPLLRSKNCTWTH